MQEYIDFITRNPVLSVAWVGLLLAVIYTSIRALLSPVRQIGHHEATMLINRQQGVVVDVRTQDEFAKGHLVDAINLPVGQIDSNNLTLIEKHKDAPTIVVCESGQRAQGAAQALVKAGFKQVFILRGGMASWRAESLPVTKKR
ncbi:MAG: rhodanese-like domain-containing protein [Aeromonadaceae bacterium]|nr:rhodanese-like domain-containing protein [Aeromonadaceae bacterium]